MKQIKRFYKNEKNSWILESHKYSKSDEKESYTKSHNNQIAENQ